ncbi:MAG TPA: 5-aminolevulinate synthase, partial [Rhodospirillaceae bacterium]|nr:5-aminolevulinate synthase [Rhodospirillaceae bacterium]
MDYDAFFSEKLNALKARGDYRIFAELERRAGHFPSALKHVSGARDD